jgi:photosystem II stability/assembly factor-like uncharacterized protein
VYKSINDGNSWLAVNQGLTQTTVQAIAVDPFNSNHLELVTGASVFSTNDAAATWVRTDGGLQETQARCIAFDPVNQHVAYIGTLGLGVYQSRDDGITWSTFSSGMGNHVIVGLNFDLPSKGGQLYAASANGAAFKLTANAPNWTSITSGLPVAPIGTVLPHPLLAHTLMAATGLGIYSSTDDGSHWTLVSAISAGLLVHDYQGQYVYAVGVHGGLFATANLGQSWSSILAGLQNVFVGALATEINNGNSVVFAGTDYGVFFTSNSGQTWTLASGFTRSLFQLTVHPNNPQVLFLGSEKDGVWKSTDGGANWQQSSDGLVPYAIYDIKQSSLGSHTLYAATSSGLYISRDQANTWQTATSMPLPKVFSVAQDPVHATVAYFGSFGGSVYQTTDDGYSFAPANSGLPTDAIINVLKVSPQFSNQLYAITGTGDLYASDNSGTGWFPIRGLNNSATSIDVDTTSPWIVYVGTAGGGVYKSLSSGLQWSQQNNGLSAPYVLSLILDPANPSTIYAGTSQGVFKTSDAANSWVSVSTGLPAGFVTRLSIDPQNARTLYASVQNQGVFTSMDGAQSWKPVNTGLPQGADIPVAVDATTSSRLYAGTYLQGLFVSLDFGAHWSRSSSGMSTFVRGIAINPANPSIMYAASLLDGVFKSSDGGVTWTNTGLRDQTLFNISVDPASPNTVYVASSNGVQKSTDGGNTWAALGQKSGFVMSMAVDPKNRSTIYIGSLGGQFYRSSDDGKTWVSAGAGLPSKTILAIAVDPISGTVYAAPENSGVYRSTDSGQSWLQMDTSFLAGAQITSITINPAAKVMYAVSNGAGVFVSFDSGGHWQALNQGLSTPIVSQISFDPQQPATTYAATLGGGLYKSINAGALWQQASNGITQHVTVVTPDPAVQNSVFAGTDAGVFQSTDAGQTWSQIVTGLPATSVADIQFDLSQSGTIYVATASAGIFKSTDHGKTWFVINQGVPLGSTARSLALGAIPGELYLGLLGNGLIRSTDGGGSWSGGASPQAINPFVLSVAVDPQNAANVYAGTSSGVLKSINGGIDWSPAGAALGNNSVLVLTIDPVASSTVYVGTAGGVYVSDDGGQTWVALFDGMFHHIITSVAIDKINHKIIYAGTEGGGAYKNVRP